MNSISDELIHKVLESCGFVRHHLKSNLFLIEDKTPLTPAFYCIPIKRRGRIGLGGGLGIYFREFEHVWRTSLSKEDRRRDATLPLMMLIDNYLNLVERNVFELTDDIDDIATHSCEIYNLCAKLPKSVEDFSFGLREKKLLGKSVSDYFHIFEYNDDDNLYFRKSVGFVFWFADRWPEYAKYMYQCLTERQLQRIEHVSNRTIN